MSFIDGRRGRRFSQLYLQQGEPGRDSARMRRRLAANWPVVYEREIISRLFEDLGEVVPQSRYDDRGLWGRYFEEAKLADVLDAITTAFEVARDRRFLEAVATIFVEENLGYRVDAEGVVHFAVDAEQP